MTDKQLSIGTKEYLATDRVILAALAFITLLTILFYSAIKICLCSRYWESVLVPMRWRVSPDP